jgi:hypothetical protein
LRSMHHASISLRQRRNVASRRDEEFVHMPCRRSRSLRQVLMPPQQGLGGGVLLEEQHVRLHSRVHPRPPYRVKPTAYSAGRSHEAAASIFASGPAPRPGGWRACSLLSHLLKCRLHRVWLAATDEHARPSLGAPFSALVPMETKSSCRSTNSTGNFMRLT